MIPHPTNVLASKEAILSHINRYQSMLGEFDHEAEMLSLKLDGLETYYNDMSRFQRFMLKSEYRKAYSNLLYDYIATVRAMRLCQEQLVEFKKELMKFTEDKADERQD